MDTLPVEQDVVCRHWSERLSRVPTTTNLIKREEAVEDGMHRLKVHHSVPGSVLRKTERALERKLRTSRSLSSMATMMRSHGVADESARRSTGVHPVLQV